MERVGPDRNLLVLCAALLIQGLCLLGLLASDVVPFPTEVSLAEAVGRVILEWPDAIQHQSYLIIIPILLAGSGIAIAYSFSKAHRWRLILNVVAILLPAAIVLPNSSRAVAILGVSVAVAVPVTIEMLLSPMDGENWETVPFAAIGWWIILWAAVLIREMARPSPRRRGFPVPVQSVANE